MPTCYLSVQTVLVLHNARSGETPDKSETKCLSISTKTHVSSCFSLYSSVIERLSSPPAWALGRMAVYADEMRTGGDCGDVTEACGEGVDVEAVLRLS